jgi:uncharacterized protein YecE (DUF72 family)
VEVRHESFRDPAFVALAREAGVAIVFGDGADYPCVADLSGDFAYARLQGTKEEVPTGYTPDELDRWAAVARGWATGGSPAGLPYVAEAPPPQPREAYVFMIAGAKVRAPQAAIALMERL